MATFLFHVLSAQVREFNLLFAQIRLGCCFFTASWTQSSGPELKHKALGNLAWKPGEEGSQDSPRGARGRTHGVSTRAGSV